MAMNNPAFSRNAAFQDDPTPEQLQALFDRPAAGDVMTVEDSVAKTGLNFAILVVTAIVGWNLVASNPAVGMTVVGIAALAGFALAMVNIFKREPSAPLVLLYSAAQGLTVGAISMVYEVQFEGIVLQAVLATFAVFGVTLALFVSGKVRASARANKVFMIAIVGYMVYALLNMVLVLFGVVKSPFGLDSQIEIFGIPLGVILGVLVTIMGAYSLVLDFDSIQQGVRHGAPKKYGWTAAFGIMVTMIWLYMNILRTIAIARSN